MSGPVWANEDFAVLVIYTSGHCSILRVRAADALDMCARLVASLRRGVLVDIVPTGPGGGLWGPGDAWTYTVTGKERNALCFSQ